MHIKLKTVNDNEGIPLSKHWKKVDGSSMTGQTVKRNGKEYTVLEEQNCKISRGERFGRKTVGIFGILIFPLFIKDFRNFVSSSEKRRYVVVLDSADERKGLSKPVKSEDNLDSKPENVKKAEQALYELREIERKKAEEKAKTEAEVLQRKAAEELEAQRKVEELKIQKANEALVDKKQDLDTAILMASNFLKDKIYKRADHLIDSIGPKIDFPTLYGLTELDGLVANEIISQTRQLKLAKRAIIDDYFEKKQKEVKSARTIEALEAIKIPKADDFSFEIRDPEFFTFIIQIQDEFYEKAKVKDENKTAVIMKGINLIADIKIGNDLIADVR